MTKQKTLLIKKRTKINTLRIPKPLQKPPAQGPDSRRPKAKTETGGRRVILRRESETEHRARAGSTEAGQGQSTKARVGGAEAGQGQSTEAREDGILADQGQSTRAQVDGPEADQGRGTGTQAHVCGRIAASQKAYQLCHRVSKFRPFVLPKYWQTHPYIHMSMAC